MSPATHLLLSWLVASSSDLDRRERIAVTIAGVAPDLDGLGAIPELLTRNSGHPLPWYSEYHHVLGHNILAGVALTLLCAAVATRRWKTAVIGALTFHLHLLGDIVGARGPDGYSWPVPYLLPFSDSWQLTWSHQWALNAWQNFLITGVALAATFYLAWRRGYSPLELVSVRANQALVSALRQRFPHPEIQYHLSKEEHF